MSRKAAPRTPSSVHPGAQTAMGDAAGRAVVAGDKAANPDGNLVEQDGFAEWHGSPTSFVPFEEIVADPPQSPPPGGWRGEGAPLAPPEQEQQPQPEQEQPATEPAEQPAPAEPASEPEPAAPAGDEPATTDEEPGAASTAPDTPEANDSTDEEAIAGILAKYPDRESLGQAYRNMQRAFTAKGEEAAQLRTQAGEYAEVIDRHFERTDDGKLVLRAESAADRLREVAPPPVVVNEDQVRQQVTAKYRAFLNTSGIPDDELDEAVARNADQINAEVSDYVQQQNERVRNHREARRTHARSVVNNHFAQNPDHKAHVNAIDRWYQRFPEPLRTEVIAQGMLPIHEIAALEEMRANVVADIKQAFEKGVEAGRKGRSAPVDGSQPQPSAAPAPQPGAVAGDYGSQVKQGILNHGNLPSLFD